MTMEEIMRRVFEGEAVKGMLGLGLDEEDGSLHVLFQEDGAEDVEEMIVPSMVLGLAMQMLGALD